MPSLRPQTLQINDRKWVVTYSPPHYSGMFMQKGVWVEETFRLSHGNEWYPTGGGSLYTFGIETEEEVLVYLLDQATKYFTQPLWTLPSLPRKTLMVTLLPPNPQTMYTPEDLQVGAIQYHTSLPNGQWMTFTEQGIVERAFQAGAKWATDKLSQPSPKISYEEYLSVNQTGKPEDYVQYLED